MSQTLSTTGQLIAQQTIDLSRMIYTFDPGTIVGTIVNGATVSFVGGSYDTGDGVVIDINYVNNTVIIGYMFVPGADLAFFAFSPTTIDDGSGNTVDLLSENPADQAITPYLGTIVQETTLTDCKFQYCTVDLNAIMNNTGQPLEGQIWAEPNRTGFFPYMTTYLTPGGPNDGDVFFYMGTFATFGQLSSITKDWVEEYIMFQCSAYPSSSYIFAPTFYSVSFASALIIANAIFYNQTLPTLQRGTIDIELFANQTR